MKILLLLLLLSCFSSSPVLAQQSSVAGVVSIFNSATHTGKRQYVTNAQVKDDFGKATPRLTGSKGEFLLTYVGVREGQSVSFQVISSGLQVVNTTALAAIAGQVDSVRVSMAQPDSISAYKSKLYGIGKTEAEKRLTTIIQTKNQQLAQLRKNAVKNGQAIKEAQSELARLEEQLKKVDVQAQELARTYAPVNLDDVSSLFRTAFLLFQTGRLDSALVVLNKADLPNQVRLVLLEREKLTAVEKVVAGRHLVEKNQTKNLSESLQLQANLYQAHYEMERAEECYQLLIKLDPTNPRHLFSYGFFLIEIKGNPYRDEHETAKAEEAFLEALAIYKRLAQSNPQAYEPNVASAQNNLGNLYRRQHKTAKAESAYLEALTTHKRLAQDAPQTFEPNIAGIQNNLGLLYTDQHETAKAEEAFLEALAIYKRLAQSNPQAYEPNIAKVQKNVGELYDDEHKVAEAERAYVEALAIYRRLAKENPQAYDLYVAAMQNNLGLLYTDQHEIAKAEGAFLEALAIRKRLAKANRYHEADLAVSQNSLGNLYRQQHEVAKAESAYLEALTINKRLAQDAPRTFEPSVAKVQNNLGLLYTDQHETAKAEEAFLEALAIYKRLAQSNPQAYEPNIAKVLDSLGMLYADQHKVTKAENAYLEALTIYKRLAKDHPQTFQQDLDKVQNALAGLATMR